MTNPETERLLLELTESLERLRERKGLTLIEWAKASGLSHRGLLFRLLRSDPHLSTLVAAASGVDRRLRVTFDRKDDDVRPEAGGGGGR